ncbi:hypothetical protein [Nostoc sp.]|nr:hypothetical protein [Nostoc sp.]
MTLRLRSVLTFDFPEREQRPQGLRLTHPPGTKVIWLSAKVY